MEKNGTKLWRVPGRLLSTLRARLIALVLLASLPALSLIVYTNIEQRQHDRNEAVTGALEAARHVADQQMELVQATRTILSVLSSALEFEKGPGLSPLFAELVSRQKVYSFIGFAGPDGELIAGSIPFTPPVSAADRPYFRQAVKTLDFSIGNYQTGRLTKEAGINFGYPVVKNGRLEGVLFAAMPITVLNKKLSAIPLQEGQVVNIIDSSGVVLARHPSEEGWVGTNIRGTALETLLQGGADGGEVGHLLLDLADLRHRPGAQVRGRMSAPSGVQELRDLIEHEAQTLRGLDDAQQRHCRIGIGPVPAQAAGGRCDQTSPFVVAQGLHVDAGALQQRFGAVFLAQHGGQQVHRLDVGVVVAQCERLRVAERFLEFGGEFVLAHGVPW